uniref:LRAT domain-containing protein n=1 Tax=Gopherus agassizii TaxID=38772 RepID=A0A452I8G5_9SAUR
MCTSLKASLNKPGTPPGDLIEFQRVGYQHWGIYVGKGYVVHFTFPEFFKAKVQKERLRNVARVSSYAVNNQLDKKHPPLPLSHVVKRAEHLVGKNIDYNLVMSNCEHFATLIRYGIAESQQVMFPKQNISEYYIPTIPHPLLPPKPRRLTFHP